MPFAYPCPECGSENRLHEIDCKYENTDRWRIEKAYSDLIISLTEAGIDAHIADRPPGIDYEALVKRVEGLCPDADGSDGAAEESVLTAAQSDTADTDSTAPDPPGEPATGWTERHSDCLAALKRFDRVVEREEMGGIYLLKPDERGGGIIPQFDPLKTVFECGPVDGCKDMAIYSMVSWCELRDLSWDGTESFIAWWLTETNRWASESWGESEIAEVCAGKRHVHAESMGWGDHPETAKRKLETVNADRKLDANAVADRVDRSTFE
jgi:hypothetical protein